MSADSGGADAPVNISHQLATLVPSFDPSKDDLQMYQQKVEMVLQVWPQTKISELVTRLILNTSGSAFAKLQLHHTELCTNEAKSVHKLIEHLGGHWGQTGLERRFADAERALYQCSQQSDESHDSFLARADVLWSKLKAQKLQIDDLQAYITLRGANLPSEDKKRIILDSDNTLEGKLTINRVREAVRMLGTSFFHDMTGQSKKGQKTKVYDSHTFVADEVENQTGDHEDQNPVHHAEEWHEDEVLEALLAEGDDDAVFVADYEAAASEILQTDDDLATAYSTYVEARRKLNEKVRARGFWPLGKGKSKFGKGRGKSRPTWNKKSLQQRILESNCRLCGKKGHWKSECPNRNQGTSSSSHSNAATLSVATAAINGDSVMPAEFLSLPVSSDHVMKDGVNVSACSVQSVFFNQCIEKPPSKNIHSQKNIRELRERIRNYIEGNRISNPNRVQSLVHRIEMKLQSPDQHSSRLHSKVLPTEHILCPDAEREAIRNKIRRKACPTVASCTSDAPVASPIQTTAPAEAET